MANIKKVNEGGQVRWRVVKLRVKGVGVKENT